MTDGSIRVTLDDGEVVIVRIDDVPQIYEELWRLAPMRGAVSCAALIRAPTTQSEYRHTALQLQAEQSAAFREALVRLQAEE